MSGKLYSIRFKPSQEDIEGESSQKLEIEENKDKIKHPLLDDFSKISEPIDIPPHSSPSSSSKLPHSQSAPLSELLSQLPDEKQSIFSGIRDRLAKVGAESREMIDKHISMVKSVGNQDGGKTSISSPTQEMSEVKFRELEELSSAPSSILNSTGVKSPMVNIEQLMNMVRKRDVSRDDSEFVKEIAEFCGRRKTMEELPRIRRSSSLDKMTESSSAKQNDKNKKVKDIVRYNKESPEKDVPLRRRFSHQDIPCSAEMTSTETASALPFSTPSPPSSILRIFRLVFQYISLKRSVILIVFIAYLFSSSASYFSGLLLGIFIGYVIAYLGNFFKIRYAKFWEGVDGEDFFKSLKMDSFDTPENLDGRFKGWMNELASYDPDNYHISQAHSVCVTLEGSTLRLQTPRQGIAKRALCNEEIPNVVNFVRQQHYNLRGCRVTLLPKDLTGKRLWSKKYPICFEVALHSMGMGSRPSRTLLKDSNKRHSLGLLDTSKESRMDTKNIYLFARCCREKEEWFRRFESASRGFVWPQNFSSLSLTNLPHPNLKNTAAETASNKPEANDDTDCSSKEGTNAGGEVKQEIKSKWRGVDNFARDKLGHKRSKSIDGLSTEIFSSSTESKKKKVPTATLR